MLVLNGFIKLEGFDIIDSSHMIIIKKIMGNHIKLIRQKLDITEVLIKLQKQDAFRIDVSVKNGKELEKSATNSNVFTAVDECFKQIEKEL